MFKKICYISTNRSEYAKIKVLLTMINSDIGYDLSFIAGGTLLNKRYGSPIKDIISDGINVSDVIDCLFEGDTPQIMIKEMSMQMYEAVNLVSSIKPDLGIVVGDRFDALPNAIVFSLLGIPVAHVQGGEVSGTIDNVIRDAITKLSHLHFVATETAAKRIEALGEDAAHIHTVGCPSIDFIKNLELPKDVDMDMLQPYCKKIINLEKDDKYMLVLVHPNICDPDEIDIDVIFDAINCFPNKKVVFYPNNDPFHEKIVSKISSNEDIYKFKHLPMDVFLMLLSNASCLIGNSSSGIREAGIFGIPVVDIGTRQERRERGRNVINVSCKYQSIQKVISYQMTQRYPKESIYGDGSASKRIIDILKSYKYLNYKNVRMP